MTQTQFAIVSTARNVEGKIEQLCKKCIEWTAFGLLITGISYVLWFVSEHPNKVFGWSLIAIAGMFTVLGLVGVSEKCHDTTVPDTRPTRKGLFLMAFALCVLGLAIIRFCGA